MYVYIYISILCLDRSTLLDFESSVLDRSPVRRWKAEPRLSWKQLWRLHRSVSVAWPPGTGSSLQHAAGLLLYSSNTCHSEGIAGKAMRCCFYCCCCCLLLLHKSSKLLHPGQAKWLLAFNAIQYAHSSPNKQYSFLAFTDTWQRHVKVFGTWHWKWTWRNGRSDR